MGIRILIADDHSVLRAGLHALLSAEPDLEVVGEAADGREALRLTQELLPDIVLLDVSMPGMDGMEVVRQLKRAQLVTRVLILTMHEDADLAREAIQAGAAGFLIKRAVESELINAVHAVVRGDVYLHPSLTRTLFKEASSAVSLPSATRSLTPREVEVMRLIAQGYTNGQIAEGLRLSVRTVEIHRMNLVRKLGLNNTMALASNHSSV